MDAASFGEDDLTWAELSQMMPEGVKDGAHAVVRLGGVLFFMIAMVGCAFGYVLMLSWVVLHWFLTRLFLLTASLLRAVYDEPLISQQVGTNGSLRDSAKAQHQQSSVNNLESYPISAADLDSGDRCRSNPSIKRGEHDNASQTNKSHAWGEFSRKNAVEVNAVSSKDLDLIEKQHAEEKIAQQEIELQAQIQRISQRDKERFAPSATQCATPSQPRKGPQDVAHQWSLSQQLNGGSRPSSRTSQDTSFQPKTGTSVPATAAASRYTPEQLAEAANFSKDATRGQPSRRHKVNAPNALKHTPSRPGSTVSDVGSRARSLDPGRYAKVVFTASPSSLPPHLKKLNEAKEAKQSSVSTLPSGFVATEPSALADIASPSEIAALDEENQIAPVRERDDSGGTQTRDLCSAEALPPIHPPFDPETLPNGPSGSGVWETEAVNEATKGSSFDQLLQSDQTFTEPEPERTDCSDKVGRVDSQSAPVSTIEAFKAVRSTCDELPGSFIAKIERELQKPGLHRTIKRAILADRSNATSDGGEWLISDAHVSALGSDSLHHDERQTMQGLEPTSQRDTEQDGSREEQAFEAHQREDGDEVAEELTTNLAVSLPDISNQSSADRSPPDTRSERKALFRHMADALTKRVEDNGRAKADSQRSHNGSPSVGAAQAASTTPLTPHELDLIGLDFSIGAQSPKENSTPTQSVRTTKPHLHPAAEEFSPAPSSHPTPQVGDQKPARPTPSSHAEPSNGSIHTAISPPRVPLFVPSQSHDSFAHQTAPWVSTSMTANMLPSHSHAASMPSSTFSDFYTPFTSPQRDWRTYPLQAQPNIGGYPNGTSYAFPSNATLPGPSHYFTPGSPATGPTSKVSTSRAIAIVKPPEMKYHEQFPKLPSKRPNVSATTFEPPPGLTRSNGSELSTLDALLLGQPEPVAQGTSVATSNPFDALLENGKEASHLSTVTKDTTSQDEQSHAVAVDNDSSSKTQKKKRKSARAALAQTCLDREVIRKRVSGCYTLDGVRALEYATRTYNDLRRELANLMANGELRDEDAKYFPHLAPADLSVPRVRGSAIQKLIPEGKIDFATPSIPSSSPSSVKAVENKAPKKSDDEIQELTKAAIAARNVYAEAHAFFNRPPPQGRTSRRELRAQGEARIERAAKHYKAKRDALTAAYGGELPASISEKLWVYDDAAKKRERDLWML